jgi:hypothetical protein
MQKNLKPGLYTVQYHINISPYFIEALFSLGILFSVQCIDRAGIAQ